MRHRPGRSMRGQFKVNSLDVLLQSVWTIWDPVAVALRQLDVHLCRSLSCVRLKLDLPVEVPQKPRLTRQNLRTTRRTMARQNVERLQSQRLVENIRPVRNVRIEQ